MPQRYGEAEIELAQESLRANRMLYWCKMCGRPRKRNYCPAAARSKNKRHDTVLRSTLSPNEQLGQYLYQGSIGVDEENNTL